VNLPNADETTDIDGLAIRFGRTSTDQHRPLLLFNGIGASLELIAPFAQAMQREGVSAVIYGPVDVLGVSWGGALARFCQSSRQQVEPAVYG
jgi:hypothetical protein